MSAEDNFDKLNNLRPVLDTDGLPIMSSGNFAVVFKMKDVQNGKFYAIKCFLKEQEGREESYRLIEEELNKITSTYLISIHYMANELFVDTNQTSEREFPVLQMDWIEGKTLDKYLRENIDFKYNLEILTYRFSVMAQWLISQSFAHGDLKPDNIFICDNGEIVLVDYDGMYVPAMKGQKARELGSPDFRHPLRTENDFDEHIDDFSLISILLSLRAIFVNPLLLEKYGAMDRLLFSERDYHNINECCLMKEIFPSSDNVLNNLISAFWITYSKVIPINKDLCSIDKPKESTIDINKINTEWNVLNPTKTWFDDLALYTADKQYLISGPDPWEEVVEYKIESQTKIICDKAFSYRESLRKIVFPYGVVIIGEEAFSNCGLKSLELPSSVKVIKKQAFSWCRGLNEIILPDSVVEIENMAFWWCLSLEKVILSKSLAKIGYGVFEQCENLKEITIPSSVREIKGNPFPIHTLCKVTNNSPHFTIKDDLFFTADLSTIIACLSDKNEFVIPNQVKTIGVSAFESRLVSSVIISNYVTHIEYRAFARCDKLRNIIIPKSVEVLEKHAFHACRNLESITIYNPTIKLGYDVFQACDKLQFIKIPRGSRTEFEKCIPYWNSSYTKWHFIEI